MKELTIKEKAEAYDYAVNKARELILNENGFIRVDKPLFDELFPSETEETEDEIARRGLLEWLKKKRNNTTIPFSIREADSWIAYLEKQGEQDPVERFDYSNANIQQKDYAGKTVGELEAELTPLENKVKDCLFDFLFNATDGISFDDTMGMVHNIITLCQNEQNHWKPSEEQMEALESIIPILFDKADIISELYKQLKAL